MLNLVYQPTTGINMQTYLLTKTGIIYTIVGEDSINEIYYVTIKGMNMQYEVHHNNVFLIDSNLSLINDKKRIHFKG